MEVCMHMDKVTDRSKLVEIISALAQDLSISQLHDVINYIKIIAKGDEKRDTARKSVMFSVDYSVKDELYSDLLDNISSGGAFICSTRLFQIGNPTTIDISHPKMEKNIRIKGEIVRLTAEGFGVSFTEKKNGMLSLLKNVHAENSIFRNYLLRRAI
jgi:Tfp pilus assembly protein PilZ